MSSITPCIRETDAELKSTQDRLTSSVHCRL